MDKHAIYVKEGHYFSGVPARDLSKAEWEALDADLRQAALDQGVYELAQPERRPTKKEEVSDE